MAVDTRQKRFSMMNFGVGQHFMTLPEADGAIDADDRAHFLTLYSGITLAAPGGGRIMSSLVGPGGLVQQGGLGGFGGGLVG